MKIYRGHNKYGNQKVVVDGIRFDSKHEAVRFQELRLLERTGAISGLRRQVKYILIPAQREASTETFKKGENKGKPKPGRIIEQECSYIADFTYFEHGKLIVEDAKGFKTEAYKIKKKLMLLNYGIRIKEV